MLSVQNRLFATFRMSASMLTLMTLSCCRSSLGITNVTVLQSVTVVLELIVLT